MTIKKIFFASALFLCFCKTGFSKNQDTSSYEYQYRLWGAGVKQQKMSFITPLFHLGASLAFSGGRTFFRNKKLTTSNLDVSFDIFQHPNNSTSATVGFGVSYTYNKYYRLLSKAASNVFPDIFVGWGGWVDSQLAIKPDNTNNLLYYHQNYMGCLTFAATGRIKSVRILNELSAPIAGVYIGSQYSSILPYFVGEEDADLLDDVNILFINKNLQLRNTLSADFKLKFRRRYTTMRVQYELGARALRLNNNELINIYHLIKIGYLFNSNTISYVHK